jgi:hypothetical protein
MSLSIELTSDETVERTPTKGMSTRAATLETHSNALLAVDKLRKKNQMIMMCVSEPGVQPHTLLFGHRTKC